MIFNHPQCEVSRNFLGQHLPWGSPRTLERFCWNEGAMVIYPRGGLRVAAEVFPPRR